MNCPNCQAALEYENHVGKNTYNRKHDMPQAQYWCDDCGLEADWHKLGNRFVVTYDPRTEGSGSFVEDVS